MKILLFIGIVFFLLFIYSVCVVAGKYDEQMEKHEKEHRKEGQKDVSAEVLGQAENTSKDN